MKLIASIVILTLSFFAESSEIMLICSNSEFEDLNQIVISRVNSEEILVTEISRDGSIYTYSKNAVEYFENNKVELSDWNGYRRELTQSGSSWKISYHDGCDGGTSKAICK